MPRHTRAQHKSNKNNDYFHDLLHDNSSSCSCNQRESQLTLFSLYLNALNKAHTCTDTHRYSADRYSAHSQTFGLGLSAGSGRGVGEKLHKYYNMIYKRMLPERRNFNGR